MSNRRKVAAANWKMNLTIDEAKTLLSVMAMTNVKEGVERIICTPYTHIGLLAPIVADIDGLILGAQDLSEHESGAYTGEVSAAMLRSLGIDTVIIGHSERRQYHSESNVVIGSKLKKALEHDMTPILCCGEPKDVREKNNHVNYVIDQLTESFEGLQSAQLEKLIIAYEPVWAIGTGLTASADQAQEMHAAIRLYLARRFDGALAERVPILYGGSVKPNNAEELFSKSDVDGGLVGGASLSAQDFAEIANSFSV